MALFDGWWSVGRVVLTAALAYAAVIAMLRVSGKRTLAKLNAFDLVVTVALGSTVATVITSRDVPLADGVAAIAALVGLQTLVAWGSSRSRAVKRVVTSEPRVLFWGGALARRALREERLSDEEVLAAIRRAGLGIGDVDAVVLETSGDLSVLRKGAATGPGARVLDPVRLEGATPPGVAETERPTSHRDR